MTQKKTYRISQINRLMQEEIAGILLMEMQDEHLHNVTVTEVRTAKDLSHAIVFVTTHKGEPAQDVMDHLHRAAGYIRKTIFGRVRLKRVPELEFRYDDSLDHAERIFRALHEVQDDLDVAESETPENDSLTQ